MAAFAKKEEKGRYVKHVRKYCENESVKALFVLISNRQEKTDFIQQTEKQITKEGRSGGFRRTDPDRCRGGCQTGGREESGR